MTTSQIPKWLNLDAIHPAEERAKIPGLVDAARGVLEAVVAFNRQYVEQAYDYYHRNNSGPDNLEQIDELTGMAAADEYLLLAGHIIEATVVGQGAATSQYAKTLAVRHADLIEGVRSMYRGDEWAVPMLGEEGVR